MEQGLTQIYWGEGKGKTTAALGSALRALGHGCKVHLVQFLKKNASEEIKALEKFGSFSSKQFGTGEWATEKTKAEDKKEVEKAFSHLEDTLKEGYDLIIADELLYALQMNLVKEEKLVNLIKSKPKTVELIITGSHKPFPNVFESADLVTEMKKLKHPFDSGVPARKAIEF